MKKKCIKFKENTDIESRIRADKPSDEIVLDLFYSRNDLERRREGFVSLPTLLNRHRHLKQSWPALLAYKHIHTNIEKLDRNAPGQDVEK